MIKLLLGGDVNIQARQKPASAFQHLLPLLAEADVRFVNLEGPLSGSAGTTPGADIPHKPNWTHSDPSMVDGLTAAGIDVVSCANNVTFPPWAALASMEVLDQAGVAHCGAGADRAAAHAPAVVEHAGQSVAFLAYTSICWPFGHAATANTAGVAAVRASTSYLPDHRVAEVPGRPPKVLTAPLPEDLEHLVQDVSVAREQADFVVVSMHWGIAGEALADYQITIAHAAIEAGADLVAGHGPHTVQAVEVYRCKPIFYSLGNLVFDWPVMYGRHLDGLLVEYTLGEETARPKLIPVRRNDDNDCERLAGRDADSVLRQVARLSAARSTVLDIDNGIGTVDLGAFTPAPDRQAGDRDRTSSGWARPHGCYPEGSPDDSPQVPGRWEM